MSGIAPPPGPPAGPPPMPPSGPPMPSQFGPPARRRRYWPWVVIGGLLALGLVVATAYATGLIPPGKTTTGGPGSTTTAPSGPGTEPTAEPTRPPDADPCRAVPAKLVQRVITGAAPVRTPPGTFMPSCLWVGTVPGKPTRYRVVKVEFKPFYAKGPKEALKELSREVAPSGTAPPSVGGQKPGAFESRVPGSSSAQVVAATSLGEEETVAVRIIGYEMRPAAHGTYLRKAEDPGPLVREAWRIAGGVRPLDPDSMDPNAELPPSRYKPVTKLPADVCALLPKTQVAKLVGSRNDLIALPSQDKGSCTWKTEPYLDRGAIEGELDISLDKKKDPEQAHISVPVLVDSAIGLTDNLSVVRAAKPLGDLGEPGESYLFTGVGRMNAAAKSDHGTSVVVLRRANLTLTVKYTARKDSGELFVPGEPIPAAETDRAVQDVAKQLIGAL